MSIRYPEIAGAHSLEQHRKRIWLLAGGSRGAPDSDALLARASGNQRGHDRVAKMIEWQLVTEEESLVRGHRFHHLRGKRNRRLAFHAIDQFIDRGHAVAACDRQQPTLGEVLLLRGQHQA